MKHSLFFVSAVCFNFIAGYGIAQETIYSVARLNISENIAGDVDKRLFTHLDSVPITHFMGEIPAFKPTAYAKLGYDDNYLYLHFHVRDKHVSSRITAYNGPVSRDACVEFFFSPDEEHPLHYFNLEVNAGGTLLMRYNSDNQRNTIEIDDLNAIEIYHSLPKVVEPPIDELVHWTISCKIPLKVLEKYGKITRPKKGVEWKANFYKTASTGSNPHWITWSPVEHDTPKFHLPVFFGRLVFD